MKDVFSGSLVSPLGLIRLMASGTGLTNIWFEGQKYAPVLQSGPENAVIRQGLAWIQAYFDGEKPDIAELPLDTYGTSYSRRILDLLKAVPYGETSTYSAIAKKASSSPRAVGTAIARNPFILVVPCHRIIGARNALTGYAAGLERKAWLLRHERR